MPIIYRLISQFIESVSIFGIKDCSATANFQMAGNSIGIAVALVSAWQQRHNKGDTMETEINFETINLTTAETERIQAVELDLAQTECHLVMLVLE